MHRVRAVCGRVPRPLHLRARRRQPARRPGLARRAVRLHLRDQLPAVHPLRPVRRGVPHRGDHRDEAVRVQLHQPAGRHLHEGRAGGGRRRPAPAAALGGLDRHRRRRPADLGVDARHRAVGLGRLRGPGAVGGRAGLRRAAARGGPVGARGRGRHRRGRRHLQPPRRAGRSRRRPRARGQRGPRRRRPWRDGRARRLRRGRSRLPGRGARGDPQREPGACRAVAGRHAVRHRGAVRGARGQLPRRGSGHRLRRRHRRAVPLRHHAARRRPVRRPAGRAARRPARRGCRSCRSASSPSWWAPSPARATRSRASSARSTRASPTSSASARRSSPTTSTPSRSRRSSW